MAKKRTLKPFYGKLNQCLEQAGRALMKAGRMDDANEKFKLSNVVLLKRSGRIK